MKRNVIGILTTLTLSLLISVPTSAQTIAIATIPFDFTVGQTQMPAGTYEISPLARATIVIRDSKTSKSVATLFRPEQARSGDSTSKLVFNRYGDKYFLSQVKRGFGGGVMQLPTSKLEREVQIANRGVLEQKAVVATK
jgi:hypothetical protein